MKENLNENLLITKNNSRDSNNNNLISQGAEEIFIDDDDGLNNVDEEENDRNCCCNFFYTIFCCRCGSKEKSKDFYRKKWKSYLFKEGLDGSDLAFNKLTRLFANADEDTIKGLGDFRINPNLVSQNKLRNDLEFYIPQLCTFLLFGDIKSIDEFFVFLCNACNASFFFAHRVHWFLSAMINAAEEKKEKIIEILKLVNTVFKSPSKKTRNLLDKFYIANSEDFIKYIKTQNLYFFYDSNLVDEKINIFEKIDYGKLNGYQQELFNKYRRSRDIITDYSNKEYQKLKKEEEDKQNIQKKTTKKVIDDKQELKEIKTKTTSNSDILDINTEISKLPSIDKNFNSLEYKFKSSEFLISISNFKLNNEDFTYEEDDDDDSQEYDKENENDGNDGKNNNNKGKFLDLYNSKEKIVDEFVNINKPIKDINFISSHSTLNFIEHLCDISNDLPNYPIEEQMLFLYKKLNEINKILPCNVYLPFLKDSTRNYLVCHIPLEGAKIFRTKTRCPLMLTFEIVRIDEINDELKEEQENGLRINLERNKSVASQITLFTLNNTFLKDKIISDNKDAYENDTDFEISKPVILNTRKSVRLKEMPKKNKMQELSQSTILINGKSHENSSKNKNADEIRFKNIIRKFSNNFENDRNLISRTIYEPKTKKKLEMSVNMNTNTVQKLLEDIPEKEEELTEEKMKKIEEQIKKEEEIKIKKTTFNLELLRNVFGESFLKRGHKIKKNSLFGKFNSHKIFRCIIKTHEDLRQEQFATQLINEFYQIFQLERTGLWLNTYEIISTGNDSGLVEMVNDSLSLDQLKHKLDHISLSDFFLHYFGYGDVNSDRYKKAIKNYIASLAGYSLVCYFLQIKDRHNGNILIDNEGHLIHIDFGFLLSNSPGKGIKFETAPFKLSKDLLDVMGGLKSKYFEEFKELMRKGFTAVNKHRHKISILVEMMWCGHGKNLDCFEKGQEAINELKERLNPKDDLKKNDINNIVDDLINQSAENWRTKWYDIFQSHSNGIFY